jgi:hypothetical protein
MKDYIYKLMEGECNMRFDEKEVELFLRKWQDVLSVNGKIKWRDFGKQKGRIIFSISIV